MPQDIKKFEIAFSASFGPASRRHPSLQDLESALSRALTLMIETVESGGKILVAGNGGSHSDAEHIAGELLKSFYKRRPLKEAFKARAKAIFPSEVAEEMIQSLQEGIPVISLMGHPSFSSAFANDETYEFAVAQHLYSLGKSGDVFLGISTSGNSKNIVSATRVAKVMDVKTIALTGNQGGKLSALADCVVIAPGISVHEIQELHLPIYHLFCLVIENYFFDL